jgi:hypothetical protein
MDITTEETTFKAYDKDINIDKKLSNEEVKNYIMKCLLIFLTISLLSYIPALIILFTRNEEIQRGIFYKYWWILVLFIIMHFALVTTVRCYKDKVLTNSVILYASFSFYFITLIGIDSILSLYSPELTLTFLSIMGFGIICLLFLNLFTIFDNKAWIKLAIIYTIIVVDLLIYMTLVQKDIVEFFILCIIAIIFFAYMTLQMKHLLFDYIKQNRCNYSDCGINFYLLSTMLTSTDIITCPFK